MKLRLFADNQPAAIVAIAPNSPPAVDFAARELSRYLAIITGGRFPVHKGQPPDDARVLRLGVDLADAPDLSGGKRGGYGWRVHEGGMQIAGAEPGAVLHAVYDLLETLGCRWLHVWEGGEIVPRDPEAALPFGETIREPAMTHREFTNLMPIDRQYVHHIDWMAKNRFNRFMVFANIEGSIEQYATLLEPEVLARGMQATMGHHSFRYFLPPEEFFDDHPEWYALIDGERSTQGQICTSNPAVVEVVAERVCEFMAAHPQIEMVGLWPNDGFGWCQCPACVALEDRRPSQFWQDHPRRTDTYLRFVNAVAERVAREHPDRRLSALAYVNYADAPQSVGVAENVAVCYAAFHRCLKHPLRPDVRCDRMNAAYAREFERWREVVSDDLYVFNYLMQIHTLSIPYRITRMLQPNWRWLIEVGCDGYTTEFVPEEWMTFALNAHLMGRLAWDPTIDVDRLLTRWYADIYGPAADHMQAYETLLEDLLRAAGPCTGHYDLTYAARATEDRMRPALEEFGEARALAATGEKRHWRATQQAWVALELLMRLGEWQRLLQRAEQVPEPQREPLLRRAHGAAQDLLDFAREHAQSGAVEVERCERIVRGWLSR